ncbi:hypothetical protein Tsubulata_031247 [Turnera subulata]|uniref:Uncharacterized protein n=1 Tax=Turnera subulata TaxID=218843 RepID=A0A9Q0FHZ2_9ROSI|nr:hypothetical protein Tsubulata_031247 [Turnera subulata]
MMDVKGRNSNSQSSSSTTTQSEEEMVGDLRRGPWTVEEDFKLINYIANHGEGRWNSLARCAGLKRTGKSCRLRWLNYLRPDVRRGNITLEEQLMILELHSRWGNRLIERIQAAKGNSTAATAGAPVTTTTTSAANQQLLTGNSATADMGSCGHMVMAPAPGGAAAANIGGIDHDHHHQFGVSHVTPPPPPSYTPENSSTAVSSDSLGTQVSPVSDLTTTTDYYNIPPVTHNPNPDYFQTGSIISPSGYFGQGMDFQSMEPNNPYWLMDGGEATDNLWSSEDLWFLQQQLNNM